nr:protein CPR-5 [Tanacetum cinerariifolium]
VLKRKDANGEKMSADHLSEMCTLAVNESLSNVFSDKFDCFVNNFERSFQSTLMTLRVISETSGNRERSYLHGEGSSTCNSSDFHFDMKANTSSGQEQPTIVNLDDDNVYKNPIYNEVAVHQDPTNSQQLACVAPNQLHYGVNNWSVLTTFEKSVNEQARSNDLKALEISLSMKKMRLKEAQIAVNCDSNYLERFKLPMGISKANFKANKFKTELQDSRHAQLLKNYADCLVAGLLIMFRCLTYGTYIHSH